ncbi:XRE family transcriptional regulator [Kitasatospora acidiphila]|uniref:XRE family transcriptional regulator n=1 Tax=Kitasatospora acidiphila TaxID=2567942 RepID=UPI001E4EFCD9|nr:XRE family transcriptional regulator [Kitasatospora acidiphila]
MAERIERLFQTIRRPNREAYSNEEVARACREATGESFSAVYLWQLRTGRRDNPTKRHLEALAQFFQVPATYFFEVESGDRIADELLLLGALRDAGVRDVALRAATLSPQGLTTISDLIEAIARREAEAAAPKAKAPAAEAPATPAKTLTEKESDAASGQADRRRRR